MPALSSVLLSALLLGPASAQTPITSELVAAGLEYPVDIQHAPGDADRLFIVEQEGYVQLLKDGTILPEPFLKIPSRTARSGEQGLLGLCFHPDYQQNRFFYVYYTDLPDGNSVVERFERDAVDPDRADESTGTVILGPVSQPAANHNGGCIGFSPNDGYLYIGFGDGGSANDPGCRAQDGSTFLGKMLRIDVDGGFPYVIPPDNPFVNDGSILDEIWHFGHRNPWRWCFDRANGDMYIGDVGQDAREEISFQSGTSSGGENFGWKVMEGTLCNSRENCDSSVPDCDDPAFTAPIHEYTHDDGVSITGGRVYRGCAIPDLQGTYFFADWISKRIWSFRYSDLQLAGETQITDFQERTAELNTDWRVSLLTAFGEDAAGELYFTGLNGGLFKIVAQNRSWNDLGYAKMGANGLEPDFSMCGRLDSGNQATLSLDDAPANQFGMLFVSANFNPTNIWGGTLVPLPLRFLRPAVMDANGHWEQTVEGGLGNFKLNMQWLLLDPGNSFDIGISNAIEVFFED